MNKIRILRKYIFFAMLCQLMTNRGIILSMTNRGIILSMTNRGVILSMTNRGVILSEAKNLSKSKLTGSFANAQDDTGISQDDTGISQDDTGISQDDTTLNDIAANTEIITNRIAAPYIILFARLISRSSGSLSCPVFPIKGLSFLIPL